MISKWQKYFIRINVPIKFLMKKKIKGHAHDFDHIVKKNSKI